jgi:hypothetical protein
MRTDSGDPLDGLLADGLMHLLRVTWNPATMILSVYCGWQFCELHATMTL